uniref:Uncharacterized protein n=1 Tax=Timema shepardi TaxID=629360 RepID=A0A7R9FV86_TIMSH|nr:unnamed protein product [Timema shepardi]
MASLVLADSSQLTSDSQHLVSKTKEQPQKDDPESKLEPQKEMSEKKRNSTVQKSRQALGKVKSETGKGKLSSQDVKNIVTTQSHTLVKNVVKTMSYHIPAKNTDSGDTLTHRSQRSYRTTTQAGTKKLHRERTRTRTLSPTEVKMAQSIQAEIEKEQQMKREKSESSTKPSPSRTMANDTSNTDDEEEISDSIDKDDYEDDFELKQHFTILLVKQVQMQNFQLSMKELMRLKTILSIALSMVLRRSQLELKSS